MRDLRALGIDDVDADAVVDDRDLDGGGGGHVQRADHAAIGVLSRSRVVARVREHLAGAEHDVLADLPGQSGQTCEVRGQVGADPGVWARSPG